MKDSTKTLTVHFQDEIDSKEYQFQAGDNLLEVLNAHKVGINQSCGGFGTCTTCRVLIIQSDAAIHLMNEIECERSAERNFESNERLACQIEVVENLSIKIPTALSTDN